MKISGQHELKAPLEKTWKALTDPATLQKVTPGCERLLPIGPDEFEATLTLGVALVKGTYKGKLALRDKTPPESYRLVVEGSGAPGFVKGEATLRLTRQEGGGTVVSYEGDAQVGGAIASVGQRLMEGAARMVLSQFFKNLEKELGRKKEGKS